MTDEFSGRLPFGLSELPSEPLGPEASLLPANNAASLRIRRSARGADVVNRLAPSDFEPAFPTSLASATMQMAPGGGITDALGLLPDFERGGFHPSVVSNLWNGSFGDAGWQMLGALGDGMYVTGGLGGPLLGATLKGKRAVDLMKRTARTNIFDLENLPPRGVVQ